MAGAARGRGVLARRKEAAAVAVAQAVRERRAFCAKQWWTWCVR